MVSLKNNHGVWVGWESGLSETISDYFTEVFASSLCLTPPITDNLPSVITAETNHQLLASVEFEEVKAAVFQMHPDKAQGPDGFNPCFFQKYWDIIGQEVFQLVCNFFRHRDFPSTLNATLLVLIPKTAKPKTMQDLRPIALCNVLYKVISKVLANRLKGVLAGIISENQSAFLPGRLITDNILISFELLHFLKRKSRGKDSYMALKLDLSKAFDRVEWHLLRDLMLKLGFCSRWVSLILKCISLVTYTIVSGSHEIGPIIPKRGLRQGDPLSPYLFLLCAEGLSILLRQAEVSGQLHGLKIARSAPSISHILFADDIYLFSKASKDSGTSIASILAKFQCATGQQINLQKSSIFYSLNTPSRFETLSALF